MENVANMHTFTRNKFIYSMVVCDQQNFFFLFHNQNKDSNIYKKSK